MFFFLGVEFHGIFSFFFIVVDLNFELAIWSIRPVLCL